MKGLTSKPIEVGPFCFYKNILAKNIHKVV